MRTAKRFVGKQKPTSRPRAAIDGDRKSVVRCFRVNRTMAFWLVGTGMGMGGCVLGALMPYHHPVAVAMSVLWWGIYFACLGAGVGALVGSLTEPAPPRPSARLGGAGMVTTALGLDCRAGGAGPKVARAPRGPRWLPDHHREREGPGSLP
jgi:hypothetical protein